MAKPHVPEGPVATDLPVAPIKAAAVQNKAKSLGHSPIWNNIHQALEHADWTAAINFITVAIDEAGAYKMSLVLLARKINTKRHNPLLGGEAEPSTDALGLDDH